MSYFKNKGSEQKKAQATSLITAFILSVISSFYYSFQGYTNIRQSLIYIPFGIPGAITGSFLLKKLPDRLLKKLFAIIILWAGIHAFTSR